MKPPLPPLSGMEKAYFDTIKQVTRSPRPEDLSLLRMSLDDKPVAVVAQRLLDQTGKAVGWMPLALIVDDDTADRLRDAAGGAPAKVSPEGLEGPA